MMIGNKVPLSAPCYEMIGINRVGADPPIEASICYHGLLAVLRQTRHSKPYRRILVCVVIGQHRNSIRENSGINAYVRRRGQAEGSGLV